MSSAKPFNFGVRLGIFLIVESAGLSALSVTILLLYVGYKSFKKQRARRDLRKKWTRDTDSEEWLTSDASDSSYFLNLMFAELVQAIGGLLNIRWIIDAAVTEGPLCTTQGVLKQVGDVGVALTSLIIAIHTFSVLVVRWRVPPLASKIAISVIWLFIALIIGISAGLHKGKAYYGDTDYWCWIKEEYKTERIVLEYLWLWSAAGIMLIIYGVIALVMRGIILLDDGLHIVLPWKGKNRVKNDLTAADDDEERQSKMIANLMLFYPAVYIICVFPVGLVRWLAFSGHVVPPGATIFASILFSLSGLFNAILYKITRPDLVSGPRLPTPTTPTSELPMTVRRGSSRKGQLNKRSQRGDQGHLPDFDVESFHEMDRDEGAMGHLPDMDNDSEQGHLPDIGDEESIGRAPYSVGQTGSGGPGLPSKGSLYAYHSPS